MSIIESLEKRRTRYSLTKDLPVPEEKVLETIKRVAELSPDAFDCRSGRLIVLLGEENDRFWDMVIGTFDPPIADYKQACFRGSYGTILYFYENDVVEALENKFELFRPYFQGWAMQASAMVQMNIWSALADLGVGASLHHYNPVIDDAVKEMYGLPASWKFIAQMPFGGLADDPRVKDPDDIEARVFVRR
ncbi:MAG: nitroreductase family protein [Lachnospiraceae bacterium]|nr:nitroreductase family protein [Lachnospiraceae bacterium]